MSKNCKRRSTESNFSKIFQRYGKREFIQAYIGQFSVQSTHFAKNEELITCLHRASEIFSKAKE